jgi:hypothetical protein
VNPDDQHEDSSPAALGARLRFAFEMVEAGVELMRCNLRREHPAASEERIQELLNEWLLWRRPDEFSEGSLRLRNAAP